MKSEEAVWESGNWGRFEVGDISGIIHLMASRTIRVGTDSGDSTVKQNVPLTQVAARNSDTAVSLILRVGGGGVQNARVDG